MTIKKLITIFSIFLLPLQGNSLTDILKEAEDIAIKNKLNIDEMPSAITVLTSDDIKKTGASNLTEALALLPGVELSMLPFGWSQVIMRGQKTSIDSGYDKIKIFIDSIGVNDATHGSGNFYMDFPVELIERVEVFRGANTALYGNGASSGAINIVTKKDENELFTTAGTNGYFKGGFLTSLKKEDLKIKVDGYYQRNRDNNSIYTFGINDEGFLTEGFEESDESYYDYSSSFFVKYKKLSLNLRVKNSKTGNYYGLYGVPEQNRGYQKKSSFLSELKFEDENTLGIYELKTGYVRYKADNKLDESSRYSFIGEVAINPEREIIFADEHNYFEASQEFNLLENNYLKAGIKKESFKQKENIDKFSFGDSFLIEEQPYAKEHASYDVTSIFIKDRYSVNEKLDLSFFGRQENFDKYNDEFSYQIGGVYRVTDTLLTKLVYNKAYRLPSWSEDDGGEINTEELKGIEAGVIYNNIFKTTTLELNAFSYKISRSINSFEIDEVFAESGSIIEADNSRPIPEIDPDMIENLPLPPTGTGDFVTEKPEDGNEDESEDLEISFEDDAIFGGDFVESVVGLNSFSNSDDITHNGLEISLHHKIDNKNSLYLSYSYVENNYPSYEEQKDSKQSLRKVLYTYKPTTKIFFNTFIYSRGKIKRDGFNDIPAYTRVDESIIYTQNSNNYWQLTFKNFFDEDIYYDSYSDINIKGLKREGFSTHLTYKYIF
jgi:outer membrane receptor protein involved in Fe transport